MQLDVTRGPTRPSLGPTKPTDSGAFRLLAENIPQIVFTTTPDGAIEYLNSKAAAYAGIAGDDLTGWKWTEVIHPDDVGTMLVTWNEAISSGSPCETEARLRRHDGVYRWHINRAVPHHGPDGELLGFFGTSTDIHERRCHETDLRRVSELLTAVNESTSDAIFVKDLTGRYLYVNPACATLFGAPIERIVGQRDAEFFGAEAARVITDYDAWIVATDAAHTQEEALVCQGQDYVFSTTKAPYRGADGSVLGVVGIARDITKQRRAAEVAERERERFAKVVEMVPGAICSFLLGSDGAMSLPYAAPQIERIYGISREALMADASLALERIHPLDRARLIEEIQASAVTGRTFELEVRVNHPTQGEKWIEIRSTPVQTNEGTVWHGITSDISAKKRAFDELRSQRDRLVQIAIASPAVVHTMRQEADGRLTFPFLSPRIEEIFGIGAEEIRVDPARALSHVDTEDQHRINDTLASSGRDGTPWRVTFHVNHPARGRICVEAHFAPRLAPDDPAAVEWHGAFTDVTEHERAEEQLRASRAELQSILETAPDVILSLDRERRIRFINHVNPGYRIEEVIGTDTFAFLSPETREQARAAIDAVFTTGTAQRFETGIDAPDGPLWYQTQVGPVFSARGEVVGVTMCATDISARKRAEDALRASDERYRTLVEMLPDGIFVNRNDRVTFCNPALASFVGASTAEEVLGRTPFDLFDPSEHDQIRARIAKMVAGEPAPPIEETLLHPNGTKKRVRVVARPFLDEGVPSFLVVCHDLSDMQRTAGLLGSVLESVTDAVITIDERGQMLTVNPAVTRLFGYAPTEVVGANVAKLMPKQIARGHDGFLSRAAGGIATGSPLRGLREVTALRKDGTTFPIELSVASFELDGRRHFTGVIRDISARVKLEEQFRQAHKMEAFGQLAGGVAHDFNNILTVIIGETELLVGALEPGSPMHEGLSGIYEGAQRAASLTRQLLAFSRKTVLEPKILDVNSVVRETEKMLCRLIGEDVVLTTKLTPALKRVHVDPGQLSQVLVNLAVNARDAMPNGGSLVIETANVDRLPDAVTPPSGKSSASSYVLLSVKDSGVGMTEDVRRQLFQPFFTTKGVGKGTGLGLAVVHGIVSQSGGVIAVESALEQGARFDIYLPTFEGPPGTVKRDSGRSATGGDEMILLVEDDAAIRRLAVRALQARGYRVKAAGDGVEAMEILEQTPGVHMVVTDVVMPGLDGARLGELIRARFPETRILYASGYTDDMLVRQGVVSDEVAFLAKPYTPAELVLAIRKVLDGG